MIQKAIKLKPLLSIIIAVLTLFIIIKLLGSVLIPFIGALILAYILTPVVDKLEHKFKINRKLSSLTFALLVLLAFIIVPIFLIPAIITQLISITQKIPQIFYLVNQKIIAPLNFKLGTHLSLDLTSLKESLISQQDNIIRHLNVFGGLAHNSIFFIEIIVYLILIPFALFYAIINYHKITQFFNSLIPRAYVKNVAQIFKDIDKMLAAYLRGQLSVMLIMAAYYAISLNLINLATGSAIGIITGLLVFVPYLGILSGFIFAIIIALAQGEPSLLSVVIVFAIGHVLEGGLVTPFLVGKSLGLNPIMIILALMIFAKLFGIIGVLLALPLSAIALVLLRYLKKYYQQSNYFNETHNE